MDHEGFPIYYEVTYSVFKYLFYYLFLIETL